MSIRAVLAIPGVRAPFAATLLGRLPLAAVSLIFVLHVQQVTGSFASAGLASACYALGVGASAPVIGRLVDRRGERCLLPCAAVCVAALLGFAAMPAEAPAAALIALAALTGVSMPPLGACLRRRWVEMVVDRDTRQAAFALDTSATELLFVIGPAGLAGGVGAWSTTGAIAVSAGCVAAGTLAFVRATANTRGARLLRDVCEPRHLAGPLVSPAVRSLIVILALIGVTFGSLEVGVAAVAAHHGERHLAGVLFAMLSLGSVVGGVVVVHRGSARDPAGALTRRLVVLAVAQLPLLLVPGPVVLAALLLIAGLMMAPTMSIANVLLSEAAPPHTLTEAFTWMSSGLTAGIAAGAALSGAGTEVWGVRACFVLAVGACGAAAGVGLARRAIHAPVTVPD